MFFRSFILLSLLSLNIYSQQGEYKFEHLSISDGLSHNSITGIIQDHKGFLWILFTAIVDPDSCRKMPARILQSMNITGRLQKSALGRFLT